MQSTHRITPLASCSILPFRQVLEETTNRAQKDVPTPSRMAALKPGKWQKLENTWEKWEHENK